MSITKEEAAALRKADDEYVLRPWTHPAGEPVIVASAKDCEITDIDGKTYVDFTAGYFVNAAGHCHPAIAAAATAQMHQVLQVSGKHASIPMIRLAEKLVQISPRPARKSFFATGGSEANEFALKMARQAKKRRDVAYLENGYHGLTHGALEVTASAKYRESAGQPLGTHTFALPTAYCYRCPHGPAATCKTECLDGVESTLAAHDTAAIIAEPIQAVGGIVPPQKWWERLDRIRKKLGILLIADEVQTGLGRTGKWFACDHYGLEPEIMTGGKGLSGGVGSLAVASCSAEVAQSFFGGTTPTSGGNAVSAAAGLALIEVIEKEQLIANAATMGRYFTEAAWALADPWIGDVRFAGLLGGIELVEDQAKKTVLNKRAVAAIKDTMHDDGVLITVSGLHGNVLRLQPPLSVRASHIDQCIAALGRALKKARG